MGCITTLVHRMAMSAGRVDLCGAGAAGRGGRPRLPGVWAATGWVGWLLALGAWPGHRAAVDSTWPLLEMPALARAVARFSVGAPIGRSRGDRSRSGTRHRRWA